MGDAIRRLYETEIARLEEEIERVEVRFGLTQEKEELQRAVLKLRMNFLAELTASITKLVAIRQLSADEITFLFGLPLLPETVVAQEKLNRALVRHRETEETPQMDE